jgi:hypothetical protein
MENMENMSDGGGVDYAVSDGPNEAVTKVSPENMADVANVDYAVSDGGDFDSSVMPTPLGERRFKTQPLNTQHNPKQHNPKEHLPDTAGNLSPGDKLMFHVENCVAANSRAKFYILLWLTALLCVIFTGLWIIAYNIEGANEDVDGEEELTVFWAGYLVVQTIVSGGFDPSFTTPLRQLVFLSAVLMGLMVFAVLVGFVNDSVTETMEDLNKGATKVACSGHTLILGWNESTIRVVCQIAFLRRAFLMQNETWGRYLFRWTRVKPSSPVARALALTQGGCEVRCGHHLQEAFRGSLPVISTPIFAIDFKGAEL